MANWRIFPINNRDKLRRFLDQDRPLCAYGLGDLEEPYWNKSEFVGAEDGGELRGVALFYSGLERPALAYFGDPEGLRAMRILAVRRGTIHYILSPDASRAVQSWYHHRNVREMWRMVVPRAGFKPRGIKKAQRLSWDYASTLRALLGESGDVLAIDPSILRKGVFYGVHDSLKLVAVAGTHVVSPQEGVAAVGYVYTVPEYRGKGYATACTAAVTKALLDMGLHTVVLNVAKDNAPALKVYERLGYQRYCALVEGDGSPR